MMLIFAIGVTGYRAVDQARSLGHATAAFLCDVKSLKGMQAREAAAGNTAEATYRGQEIKACQGENPDKPKATGTSSASPTVSPSASASASPSASGTVAAAPVDMTNPDNWPRYERELVTTRPAEEKVSVNSYGPRLGLEPSLRGKPLEDMTVNEFFTELKYRMPMSPVLTGSLGSSFDLWGSDASAVNDHIQSFLADKSAWQNAVADISTRMDAALAAGADKVEKAAGTYTATYSIDTTYAVDHDVQRDQPFAAVVLPDGTILRMACGGQQYWDHTQPAPPQSMPAPAPGMTRTPEGTPERKVWVCNPDTRLPIQVPESQAGTYPPVDSPDCKTPTPSPTPTPDTTPEPTPTPSCLEKECQPAPTPPPGRSPAASPASAQEISPPAPPASPATTATPVIPDPGATSAPASTESIPVVEPSGMATGDVDPDGE